MKTVLWISRHTMTEPQLRDLARVLGGTVQVLPYTPVSYTHLRAHET